MGNHFTILALRTPKEVVIYIHNGILLGHKKEHIWVSSNEVDESSAAAAKSLEPIIQSEVNSERERYISYSNAHIQNLEKWYWGIYLQGSGCPLPPSPAVLTTAF